MWGPSNQLCTHHVDGDFADFDVAEVLTELLDALLLLGDLLGQHRPQVRAGTSAREGRDGRQFLEGIKDRSWLDIVRYDSLKTNSTRGSLAQPRNMYNEKQ